MEIQSDQIPVFNLHSYKFRIYFTFRINLGHVFPESRHIPTPIGMASMSSGTME